MDTHNSHMSIYLLDRHAVGGMLKNEKTLESWYVSLHVCLRFTVFDLLVSIADVGGD